METFAATDIGLVKKRNEDRYTVKEFKEGTLLAVADGVGGNIAGHHAAKMIITTLEDINRGVDISPESLQRLIDISHKEVLKKVDEHPRLEGMAATATAAFVKDNKVFWAHVGDSRLYKINDKEIVRISKDHTMAQFLLDEGAITRDDENFEKSKNFLVQCVGGSDCEPDCGEFEIEKGDYLLIASDGLHDFVDDQEVKDTVLNSHNLKTAVKRLIKAALDTGGEDNVTVVLCKI